MDSKQFTLLLQGTFFMSLISTQLLDSKSTFENFTVCCYMRNIYCANCTLYCVPDCQMVVNVRALCMIHIHSLPTQVRLVIIATTLSTFRLKLTFGLTWLPRNAEIRRQMVANIIHVACINGLLANAMRFSCVCYTQSVNEPLDNIVRLTFT